MAKQANQNQQHSHIANITSMAPPTHTTIALPAPSRKHKHIITCPAPKQCMPGPYKAFNTAIDTAQASGSKLTIQMVKTLEQRITDTYLESPWAKVSHISNVEDSDIEIYARRAKKTKATGSLRKQTKKLAKKPVKEKKLTLASSHYPSQLNCLIGEVILMMAKCVYALPLSCAYFTILQNCTSF
jgi:hypothetical protein